jgi:fatty-acid peroxygenase
MSIPRDPTPDASLDMITEGYRFFGNRSRRLGSDTFETRLMLREALCAHGAEAARLFYDEVPFTRRGAVPVTAMALLQDRGSVQQLDGDEHRHRKALFLGMLGPWGSAQLADAFERQWMARLPDWERADRITLLDEAHELLCRAACEWAGVPLPERDAKRRTAEFVSMIEGAGGVGLRTLRGLLRRSRTEQWAQDIIRDVRDGAPAPPGSPVRAVAFHRDPDGDLLDPETAAVELINLLRPTVAIGRYVAFAAHALIAQPGLEPELATGDDAALERFAQEVRRFYPFFPAVGGRSLEPFAWRGEHFPADTWMLLDLYGTAHDPRSWRAPGRFRPDRFLAEEGDPFRLVAQGGGDTATSHRCPGERATVEVIKRAARLLTTAMTWHAPPQDLSIDLSRMPARPASGVMLAGIREVRERAANGEAAA